MFFCASGVATPNRLIPLLLRTLRQCTLTTSRCMRASRRCKFTSPRGTAPRGVVCLHRGNASVHRGVVSLHRLAELFPEAMHAYIEALSVYIACLYDTLRPVMHRWTYSLRARTETRLRVFCFSYNTTPFLPNKIRCCFDWDENFPAATPSRPSCPW